MKKYFLTTSILLVAAYQFSFAHAHSAHGKCCMESGKEMTDASAMGDICLPTNNTTGQDSHQQTAKKAIDPSKNGNTLTFKESSDEFQIIIEDQEETALA